MTEQYNEIGLLTAISEGLETLKTMVEDLSQLINQRKDALNKEVSDFEKDMNTQLQKDLSEDEWKS